MPIPAPAAASASPPAAAARKFRMRPPNSKGEPVFDEFDVESGDWKPYTPNMVEVPRSYHKWANGKVCNFPYPAELSLVRLSPATMQRLEDVVTDSDSIMLANAWAECDGHSLEWEPAPDVRITWDAEGVPHYQGMLSGCMLSRLRLDGCKFYSFGGGNGQRRVRTSFRFANLRFASLRGANLKRCEFHGATCKGAIFADADLNEADFGGANLYSADFEKARFSECQFTSPRYGPPGWLYEAIFSAEEENIFGAPDMPADLGGSEYAAADDGLKALVKLAWRTSSSQLDLHDNELVFLLDELERLRQVNVTPETWREFHDSWVALNHLYDKMNGNFVKEVIERLFSPGYGRADDAKPADDPKDTSDGSCEGSRGPRRALGMSRAMYKIRGVAPRGLLVRLKDHVGRRLRTPEYFKIRLELSQERERIQAIVDTKSQALAIVYGLFLSVAIAVANAFVSGFLGMLLGVDVEM